MRRSRRNEVAALLTLPLGPSDAGAPKPLSTREWNTLTRWLSEHNRSFEALLNAPVPTVLADWDNARIPLDRIERLLARRDVLDRKLKGWIDGNGLRLVGRSDRTYPSRLIHRLGHNAPPLLFMAGQPDLLNTEGVAIVGSRHAQEEDLQLARRYAKAAHTLGITVVSGGAQGIDRAATEGALMSKGTAISVLSDSLIQVAQSPAARPSIAAGKLLLLTPFAPDAGFTVGNAMARNKLIYCLAEAAVVVASEFDKGGTFAGAREALKSNWIPVGIVPSEAEGSGSAALVDQGGIALAGKPRVDLKRLQSRQVPPATMDESLPGLIEEFVRRWRAFEPDPVSVDDLMDTLDLQRSQVQAWLNVLMETGRVTRKGRPVRYILHD